MMVENDNTHDFNKSAIHIQRKNTRAQNNKSLHKQQQQNNKIEQNKIK